MDVRETLRQAVEMGASDIFIIAGLPLTYKVDGRQRRMEARLMPADTAAVISDIYTPCGGHSCDTFWLAGAGKAEHSA